MLRKTPGRLESLTGGLCGLSRHSPAGPTMTSSGNCRRRRTTATCGWASPRSCALPGENPARGPARRPGAGGGFRCHQSGVQDPPPPGASAPRTAARLPVRPSAAHEFLDALGPFRLGCRLHAGGWTGPPGTGRGAGSRRRPASPIPGFTPGRTGPPMCCSARDRCRRGAGDAEMVARPAAVPGDQPHRRACPGTCRTGRDWALR